MNFRYQLKADLDVERYTLGHLAREAMINRSYLSRILSGQLAPSLLVATSLATTVNRLTGLTTYTPEQFMTITRINP